MGHKYVPARRCNVVQRGEQPSTKQNRGPAGPLFKGRDESIVVSGMVGSLGNGAGNQPTPIRSQNLMV